MQRSGARDRRHPAGRRTRLIAALAALAALLVPFLAQGPARGGSVDRAVLTAVNTIELAAGSVRGLGLAGEQLRTDVVQLAGEVGDLRVTVDRAAAAARAERRALAAQVERSTLEAKHAAEAIPDITDPELLSRPLQIVSGAMHSADGFAIDALDRQAELRREQGSVAALETRVRELRYRLALARRRLLALLDGVDAATHVAAEGGGTGRSAVRGARSVRARADSVLRTLDSAEMQLRAAEAQLLGLSVATAERSATARRQMGGSRRMLRGLYGDMLLVQSVLADRLPSWSAVFEGVNAPRVVAAGPGPLYVCPVDPPRSYSDDWGAPRYAGGFHLHQGNDIFALEGTPIRAPFDGTAVRTPNTLGGNAVTVYGADGYAYNAHLSAYGVTGTVTAGTIVGYVGHTGDADASPPHDHFEWHPGNGAAVDPFPYLNAVC